MDRIAQQAGVTVQTVLRRFQSKRALFAAVAGWRASSIKSERDAVAAGDLHAAISTLVDSYERWGDEVLHLLAEEQSSPLIRDVTASGRRYHHAWVRRVFSPPLDGLPPAVRERRLAQLIAITDLYTWKTLRRDLELPRDEVEASLRDLMERILATPATPR